MSPYDTTQLKQDWSLMNPISCFIYIYVGIVCVCRLRVCDGLDWEARQKAKVEAREDEAESEEHGEGAVRRSLQSCREHAQRSGGYPEEHLHTAGVRLGAAHQQTCT